MKLCLSCALEHAPEAVETAILERLQQHPEVLRLREEWQRATAEAKGGFQHGQGLLRVREAREKAAWERYYDALRRAFP